MLILTFLVVLEQLVSSPHPGLAELTLQNVFFYVDL